MLTENDKTFLKETLKEYITDNGEMNKADTFGGQILLLSDNVLTAKTYRDAVSKAGGRMGEALPLENACVEISKKINAAAVIIEIPDMERATQSILSHVEQYCIASECPMIVKVELETLDAALGQITYPYTEYLLNDDPAEMLVAIHDLAVLRKSVFDTKDGVDLTDLKKISVDVERIARALVQLSGPDAGNSSTKLMASQIVEPEYESKVSDMAFGFQSSAQGEIRPIGSQAISLDEIGKTSQSISPDQVRNFIKARRLRDQYFDQELFADPAWDMLLDLMAARLENIQVSVSSLCIAASVPPTTALRWIKTMTEEKIFERHADEKDGRRIFIALSDEATAGMIGFFSMIRRSKLLMI